MSESTQLPGPTSTRACHACASPVGSALTSSSSYLLNTYHAYALRYNAYTIRYTNARMRAVARSLPRRRRAADRLGLCAALYAAVPIAAASLCDCIVRRVAVLRSTYRPVATRAVMHRRKHSRTKHGGSTHFLRPLRTTEHRMHCQYREKNEYH